VVVRWLYLIISVSNCQGRYFRENKTQERPCILTLLAPHKKYTATSVFYLKPGTWVFSGMRFISKLAYLRRRCLSSRHWFGCGLSKCEVDCTSMLLDRRAGALKRMFSFHEGISQWFMLVDAVNRIWWENSCIDCITLLIYINLLAPKFYI